MIVDNMKFIEFEKGRYKVANDGELTDDYLIESLLTDQNEVETVMSFKGEEFKRLFQPNVWQGQIKHLIEVHHAGVQSGYKLGRGCFDKSIVENQPQRKDNENQS